MTKKRIILILFSLYALSACHYLDIVPDNVATIDYAFRLRSQAEKYLYTCYSYLPKLADIGSNPALLSGDEIWYFYPYQTVTAAPPDNWEIARGNQNKINPYLDYWTGTNRGKPLFQAIRDCNTFLANIGNVPGMDEMEKDRWKSEVMFLKAYYHWFLLRMYGPIPITDQNMPIFSGPDEVKVYRQPVDSCFNYIVNLIDSSLAGLPAQIDVQYNEMGRVTKVIALALKARILVTAASPLFNGNHDYDNFVDNKGTHLFNSKYDPDKWKRAEAACKEAVDACEAGGYHLYHFNPAVNTYALSPDMQTQMDIRNAVCEKWNSEIIWGSTNSMATSIQRWAQANIDPSVTNTANARPYSSYAPTMRIAEMFYTKNGVPIDEDKTWDYTRRFDLDTATKDDRYEIQPDYVTAYLNFNREPRYYADLGFDGGIWYGQGRNNDTATWHVEGRVGQYSGKTRNTMYSITGYYAKKLVNFLNVIEVPDGLYDIQGYPWPVIRLADLYLLYSEALNEAEGPGSEALKWIDLVRERAGIPSVERAWADYARDPQEYTTQAGLRKIIHQERLIEMAFEGERFWDLRRWKEAETTMNKPIYGWNVEQSDPIYYYQQVLLFNKKFEKKDYFWPIPDHEIILNPNLVQNPGW